MPDPILIVAAMGLAGAASAVLLWICGWPWRTARPTRVNAGWVLGPGVGFFLGCFILGIWPHWPLRQDQDRLLGLVFPAVVIVELLAGFPKVPRWLIWPLRLMVVVSVAPVLLFGSIYLPDLTGSGSSEWSPALACLILGGLAVVQAGVWALLAQLAHRRRGCRTPCVLQARSPGRR